MADQLYYIFLASVRTMFVISPTVLTCLIFSILSIQLRIGAKCGHLSRTQLTHNILSAVAPKYGDVRLVASEH